MSSENLTERIQKAMSRSDLNHWLAVSLPDPADWDKARQRLDSLSDQQVVEIFESKESHQGQPIEFGLKYADQFRAGLMKGLQDIEADIGDQSFSIRMEAEPGRWQDQQSSKNPGLTWHSLLFALSISGVLQAAGFRVVGTNIPLYPEEIPEGYWPEAGAIGLWSPRL